MIAPNVLRLLSLPGGTPGVVGGVVTSQMLRREDRVIEVIPNGTDRPVLDSAVVIISRDMSRRIVASGASSLTIAPPLEHLPGCSV